MVSQCNFNLDFSCDERNCELFYMYIDQLFFCFCELSVLYLFFYWVVVLYLLNF